MTQEHLGIAVALEVPFFVVITKVDIAPASRLQRTMDTVQKVLKSAGSTKVPLVVKTEDDCITAAANSLKENVVPIFCMSSVQGTGIPEIKRFLHLLPPGMGQKVIYFGQLWFRLLNVYLFPRKLKSWSKRCPSSRLTNCSMFPALAPLSVG